MIGLVKISNNKIMLSRARASKVQDLRVLKLKTEFLVNVEK